MKHIIVIPDFQVENPYSVPSEPSTWNLDLVKESIHTTLKEILPFKKGWGYEIGRTMLVDEIGAYDNHATFAVEFICNNLNSLSRFAKWQEKEWSTGGEYHESWEDFLEHQKASNEKAEKPDKEKGKKEILAEDITPTWEGVFKTWKLMWDSMNDEGKKIAWQEMIRAATIADTYNRLVKDLEKSLLIDLGEATLLRAIIHRSNETGKKVDDILNQLEEFIEKSPK